MFKFEPIISAYENNAKQNAEQFFLIYFFLFCEEMYTRPPLAVMFDSISCAVVVLVSTTTTTITVTRML